MRRLCPRAQSFLENRRDLAPAGKEPSRFQITMLIQEMGKQYTQIRFKMQKDGEPVWDQTVIDRLWVTTQREAMIESG